MEKEYFKLATVNTVKPEQYIEVYNAKNDNYQWVQIKSIGRENENITITDDNGSSYIFDNGENIIITNSPVGRLNSHKIPEWDEYFLNIAHAVSLRAKCRRRSVGAVIVDNENRILSTGYAGFPSGLPDCLDGACPRGLSKKGEIPPDAPYENPNTAGYCPSIHAEMNAVHYARTNLNNCIIYITDKPCPGCQKQLAAVGIIKAVWPEGNINPIDFYQS